MKKLLLLTTVSMVALSACGSDELTEVRVEFVQSTFDNLNQISLANSRDIDDLGLSNLEINAINSFEGDTLKVAVWEDGFNSHIPEGKTIDDITGTKSIIVQHMEKVLDIEVEFILGTKEETIDNVENGTADLMIAVADIPELIQVSLTHEEVRVYTNGVYTNDFLEYKSSATFGYFPDFDHVPDSIVDEYAAKGLEVLEVDVADIGEAKAWLEDGTIDFFVGTLERELIIEGYANEDRTALFNSKTVSIAHNNGENIALIASATQKMFDDQMNENMRLYADSLLMAELSSGSLTTLEEAELIESSQVNPIVIATPPTFAPHILWNEEDDTWSGSAFDIATRYAQVVGLNIEFDMTGDSTWGATLNKAGANDNVPTIDGIAGLVKTEARKSFLSYTGPIVVDELLAVGLKGASQINNVFDLTNKKVGVGKNFAHTDILKQSLPNKVFANEYDTSAAQIQGMLNGEVEYIVITESEYNELYINKENYDVINWGGLDIGLEIGFAFSKTGTTDGATISRLFDKVAANISVIDITNYHYGISIDMEQIVADRRAQTAGTIILFAALALVLMVGFVIFNSRRKFASLAYTDTLTKLRNREGIKADKKTMNGPVIILDLDGFKTVNDVLGHSDGDKFLYEIAKILEDIAITNKMVAYRLSGDEFLIVGKEMIDEESTIKIANDALLAIEDSPSPKYRAFNVTASAGIAMIPLSESKYDAIKMADIGLYKSKNSGKNRVEVASVEQYIENIKKHIFEEKLSNALIDDKIFPHYQAKYNAITGKIIGAEGLARWSDGEVMLFPNQFIPILEENKSIARLDVSMLTKIAYDYMRWSSEGFVDDNFRVSFNFSIITLETVQFVDLIVDLHEKIGIPYAALEMEITETMLSNDSGKIRADIDILAGLGVIIAIDDFAAGNSTLTRIGELPIKVVKLDKSLVDNIEQPKAEAILKTIYGLIQDLKLESIVEGVETKAQLDKLKEIGFNHIQGFYFARPEPLKVFKAMLKDNMIISK